MLQQHFLKLGAFQKPHIMTAQRPLIHFCALAKKKDIISLRKDLFSKKVDILQLWHRVIWPWMHPGSWKSRFFLFSPTNRVEEGGEGVETCPIWRGMTRYGKMTWFCKSSKSGRQSEKVITNVSEAASMEVSTFVTPVERNVIVWVQPLVTTVQKAFFAFLKMCHWPKIQSQLPRSILFRILLKSPNCDSLEAKNLLP